MGGYLVRTADEAEVIITTFSRHHKMRSWAALLALGLPTLAGIVVDSWDTKASRLVAEFVANFGVDRVLLRSDRVAETEVYPRGGFLVTVADLPEVAEKFLADGRLVFLLEPVSPLSDLYSIGVVVWPGDPVVVEVVGPGFDASDLKRGDMSPHERFLFAKHHFSPAFEEIEHTIIGVDEYRSSWNLRAQKTITLLLGKAPSSLQDVGLDDIGKEVLREGGASLLVEAECEYRPIETEMVQQVLEKGANLGHQLEVLLGLGEPYMLSMSVVNDDRRMVYWDVVFPGVKYEGMVPNIQRPR